MGHREHGIAGRSARYSYGRAKWPLSAPPLWTMPLLGATVAYACYVTSFPRGSHLLFAMDYVRLWALAGSCLMWPIIPVLLALDHLTRVIACGITRRFRLKEWRWYLAGLLWIGLIVACTTDWLLRWRFSANRPILEAVRIEALQRAASAPPVGDQDLDWPWDAFEHRTWNVGDYRVLEMAVFPKEQVVILTTGGFFRSGWGLEYNPTERSTGPISRRLSLGGGWYTFYYAKE
jgi:hypothetical protein